MPGKRTNSTKRSKRNGAHGRHQRKGVCMMCGAHTNVSRIEEFDNQLLCATCCDDTVLLSQYLQSGRNFAADFDDDTLDDDQLT